MFWQLVLQIVLIACNAVFACAEIAVLSVGDAKLERMTAEGNKSAARLARLTSQPARFLATIQVAITLAGFLGSAFAADNFAVQITDWACSLNPALPRGTVNAVSVILVTLILSNITLIFGELVPKRLAMRNPEKVSLRLSGLLGFVAAVFRPIVWLLTVSTNAVLRLLGIDPNASDDEVGEEDIRMMVDTGAEQGAIDPGEREIIQNVFDLGDKTVSELMTHRTRAAFLYLDDPEDVWDETIESTRHSAYPVAGEQPDDVRGVLLTDDYLRLRDRSRESVLRAVRPARFVLESTRADDAFRDMQRLHNHFAVIVDEFGGVEGVLTMTDLLEAMVGDLEAK